MLWDVSETANRVNDDGKSMQFILRSVHWDWDGRNYPPQSLVRYTIFYKIPINFPNCIFINSRKMPNVSVNYKYLRGPTDFQLFFNERHSALDCEWNLTCEMYTILQISSFTHVLVHNKNHVKLFHMNETHTQCVFVTHAHSDRFEPPKTKQKQQQRTAIKQF